ncbi:MAG: hypothetical protein V4464_07280, partial [Pseudomonadota bacterium]
MVGLRTGCAEPLEGEIDRPIMRQIDRLPSALEKSEQRLSARPQTRHFFVPCVNGRVLLELRRFFMRL